MQVTDLTLKDLSYVLALEEQRHFGRAADFLAVSQPALSKQLKSIEATLGVQLFERDKRHVHLTEVGQQFVVQARQVLEAAEKLLRQTSTYHGQSPLSGAFRLGMIASACPYLLPRFAGQLRQTYPALNLMIREGLTGGLIADLKQGHLDAVIAATTVTDDQLLCLPLFFEPFILTRQKKGAEAGLSSPQAPAMERIRLSIADIDPAELILLEDGHCLKDQTLALCALASQSALEASALNVRATSVETLIQMSAAGLGSAIVPVLSVPAGSPMSAGHMLSFAAFADPGLGRTMAIYARKSYPFEDNLRLLGQFIQATLPDDVCLLEM